MVASNAAATLSVSFADVPSLGARTYDWKELYTGKTGRGNGVEASLGVHDMVSSLGLVVVRCRGAIGEI